MSTDKGDFTRRVCRELAEACLVPLSGVAIVLDDLLKNLDAAGNRALFGSDFSPMEVGVAAVEKPAVARVHGDGSVTRAVANDRYEEDFWGEPLERPHAVEPVPCFARGLIGGHGRVFELGVDVARVLAPQCGIFLWPVDMHSGFRKIHDAAGVVEIQVSQDDVAHVGSVIPQRLYLPHGTLGLPQRRPGAEHEEAPEARPSTAYIIDAKARVHEHESPVCLQQKTVADELAGNFWLGRPEQEAAPDWTHRPAVEMVHVHGVRMPEAASPCHGWLETAMAFTYMTPSRVM
jgi:hypothetical protein